MIGKWVNIKYVNTVEYYDAIMMENCQEIVINRNDLDEKEKNYCSPL